VQCLRGTDVDGDGVTDLFDMTRPSFFAAKSSAACLAGGGTPFETWAPGATHALTSAQQPTAVAQNPAPTSYPAGGDLPPGIGQDVSDTGVPDPEGWRDGHNDCDDFASDLERALERMGYDATYTEICVPGDAGATWHSLTDIHTEEGTFWVDGATGHQFKLDAPPMGTVNTSTSGSPCAAATEGSFGVRVWPDRAARIRELGPVD